MHPSHWAPEHARPSMPNHSLPPPPPPPSHHPTTTTHPNPPLPSASLAQGALLFFTNHRWRWPAAHPCPRHPTAPRRRAGGRHALPPVRGSVPHLSCHSLHKGSRQRGCGTSGRSKRGTRGKGGTVGAEGARLGPPSSFKRSSEGRRGLRMRTSSREARAERREERRGRYSTHANTGGHRSPNCRILFAVALHPAPCTPSLPTLTLALPIPDGLFLVCRDGGDGAPRQAAAGGCLEGPHRRL